MRLFLAALLRRQDEDTLREIAADTEEVFQKSPLSDHEDIEGLKEAARGVWRTAGSQLAARRVRGRYSDLNALTVIGVLGKTGHGHSELVAIFVRSPGWPADGPSRVVRGPVGALVTGAYRSPGIGEVVWLFLRSKSAWRAAVLTAVKDGRPLGPGWSATGSFAHQRRGVRPRCVLGGTPVTPPAVGIASSLTSRPRAD